MSFIQQFPAVNLQVDIYSEAPHDKVENVLLTLATSL